MSKADTYLNQLGWYRLKLDDEQLTDDKTHRTVPYGFIPTGKAKDDESTVRDSVEANAGKAFMVLLYQDEREKDDEHLYFGWMMKRLSLEDDDPGLSYTEVEAFYQKLRDLVNAEKRKRK